MSSSTIFDNFQHTSAAWLNWSCLDRHWKPDSDLNRSYKRSSPNGSIHGKPDSEKKSDLNKVFERTLAYGAGMIGHALCAVTKLFELAIFLIMSIGLLLYNAYLNLRLLTTKEENKRALLREECHIKKFQLYESLLITAGSFAALVIDGVGIVIPPLAYKVQHFIKNAFIRSSLERFGFDFKEADFTVDNFSLEFLKQWRSRKK